MPRHAVLCEKCGYERIRIFIEQAVVSDAKTDYYIQIRFFCVQLLCLQNRIAHILSDLLTAFGNADGFFSTVPALQQIPNTSNPCFRRISAKIPASCSNPTQVAMPIFLANSVISSTRVILQ